VLIGGIATGAISGVFLGQSGNFVNIFVNGRTRLKLRTEDGNVLKLKNPDLRTTRVIPSAGDGGLSVEIGKGKKVRRFEGDEAERVISLIVPKLNSAGGNKATVQNAVREIEEVGSPEAYFERAIRTAHVNRRRRTKAEPGQIASFNTATRLAIEMALHEERERRALEGELKLLEFAWREAEEVASISDDLLVPVEAREALADARRTDSRG
jgi:hypothetical protein